MKPITYLVGDATRPEVAGPKIIPHVCNDIGVWGAGFVLAVSDRWREPEAKYREVAHDYIKDGFQMTRGSVQFVTVEADIVVANMIAQRGTVARFGRPPIEYQALTNCLIIVERYAKLHQASVHMPRIGCGLAGGEWAMVGQIVEETLSKREVSVYVYDLPLRRAA